MKLLLLPLLASLWGCAHGVVDPYDYSDASPKDSASDSAVIAEDIINSNDGTDAGTDTSVYDPCVVETDTATVYPRLTERSCTDSNGNTYHRDYYDSLLKISCWWRTTNDSLVHCSPENEQTSPQYADEVCNVPLGLLSVKGDQYIGIDTFTDGGQFATFYYPGKEYTGAKMYYSMLDYGQWDCSEETPLNFFGVKVYYLGEVVDPSTFVAQ